MCRKKVRGLSLGTWEYLDVSWIQDLNFKPGLKCDKMWFAYTHLLGCKGSSATAVYHCPPSAVSDGTPAAMYDCSKTAVSDGTQAVLQLHSTPTRTAGVQFHPEATMQHSSKVHESPGKILYALASKHTMAQPYQGFWWPMGQPMVQGVSGGY